MMDATVVSASLCALFFWAAVFTLIIGYQRQEREKKRRRDPAYRAEMREKMNPTKKETGI